jgi:hypothetical protein
MDNLEQNDLIERYLDGTLSPAELEAVEARLATDSAFRTELELHQQLHIEFADPKKLQLRDMLGDILQQEPVPSEAESPNWLKMAGIGLIVLLGILGIWWMSVPTEHTTPVSPVQPSQQMPSQQNAPNADTLAKPSEKVQSPIAMADQASFKLNPVFEARLGNGGIRSTDGDQVQMQSPASGTDFTIIKGQVKINFKGIAQADDDPQEFPLQLNIYNNKSSDTPVAQAAPIITNRKEQVEKWTFSARETLRLSPGQYYYTLERKSDGELLFVGKFSVDKKVSGL